ncbi:cryptochrome/photolyase family protein [Tepidicaulis sp. LMO-SS28]|uniref:cryptochrome/photolyase family protein n=1 Tax=Tepidicaulis sp. LMO-SS28 TaxID=3447455 RepID=UPI003EE1841A
MTSKAPAASPAIMWFRQDLRLADNPALNAAAESGAPLIPLFILDEDVMQPGGASRWWLHHSLAALAKSLDKKGVSLVLRKGRAEEALLALIEETGAKAVYWNRCYDPRAVARDKKLKEELRGMGVGAESFNGGLLTEPWTLKTKAGEPFKVFTPFWKALQQVNIPAPLKAPARLEEGPKVKSDKLEAWTLVPSRPDWAGGLRETWTPGEEGARTRLEHFLDNRLRDYAAKRDLPAVEATSGLSPHLHWGEIGPRQIWAAVETAFRSDAAQTKAGSAFLRELAWRDFSHNLLFNWPTLETENWKDEFDGFPWEENRKGFKAWTKGETGYPIVDAGMRELWHTGYMHNRVRMITASFLIKDLLIHWKEGAAWFWDTLVDADAANNAASWQWVAGSGADASPYFRIFNPVLQGEKFDPEGDYVRRWVPELARLGSAYIHKPWAAPDAALKKAGVVPGTTYPRPIVDHAKARDRALAAYKKIKKT